MAQNAIKSNNLNDVHKYIDLINDSGFDFKIMSNTTNNLLTLIFQSGDQLLRYAIICKNTDIFNIIVNKIFEREPKFKENFNYFLCNGNRVNEYKSLDENNIKDGNFIILQNLEEKIKNIIIII